MDYEGAQRRLIDAVKRNGIAYPLIRGGGVINENGVEVEVPEVKMDINGLVIAYKLSEIDGSLIQSGDIQLIVTPEKEIRIGDHIEVDGISYRVQEPNPIKPADVLLAYKPQLRA